jgi:acyl dehydratase
MATSKFPIEAGHIMMFARAIGDENPIYFDAEYGERMGLGGVIAPPTYLQASAQYDSDYGLRPRQGQPWMGSGRTPTGRVPDGESSGESKGAGGLHAEQHFEFLRPIHPGDVLYPTRRLGDTWEKQGRRGGTLVFSESVTEYRDASDQVVAIARSIGVRTQQPVAS